MRNVSKNRADALVSLRFIQMRETIVDVLIHGHVAGTVPGFAERIRRGDEPLQDRSASPNRTGRGRRRRCAPESGLVRPAMQSSKVVFPAPEGPNRMVNPGAASKCNFQRQSRGRLSEAACGNCSEGAAVTLRRPAESAVIGSTSGVRVGVHPIYFRGPMTQALRLSAVNQDQQGKTHE